MRAVEPRRRLPPHYLAGNLVYRRNRVRPILVLRERQAGLKIRSKGGLWRLTIPNRRTGPLTMAS